MKEIHDVIIQLLNHLPDSIHDDETWNWCWEELGDVAQDAVKAARKSANELLAICYETGLFSKEETA